MIYGVRIITLYELIYRVITVTSGDLYQMGNIKINKYKSPLNSLILMQTVQFVSKPTFLTAEESTKMQKQFEVNSRN